jgi:hypothetical protein
MTNEFIPENPNVFSCKKCDYNTSNKKDYNKHLQTKKHNYGSFTKNTNEIVPINPQIYSCICGKNYKHKGSLWNHKQKCNFTGKLINKKEDLQDLIIKLLTDNQEMKKENQELIHKLIDQNKQITDLIPKMGNNTTINNKQKFNINVFLNEKCKDAYSMNEFIENIDISMKNLLTTMGKGLGEGLSNIIIENMNRLSLYERPIHCTDKKRETLYIKWGTPEDPARWVKDEKNEYVTSLVKKVEHKQLKNIKQWTDKYPNYMDSESLQEEYINLIRGCTSSTDDCKNKVIKNLCDNVYLIK